MKAGLKDITSFECGYLEHSEQLRVELESKIDHLYTQNLLNHYFDTAVTGVERVAKGDFLCAYLLSQAPKDYMLSGKLLQGIKTWFNMYYNDRLSVINKFRTCYLNAIPPENINEKPAANIAFCKFLIGELLGMLAESRWQPLLHHAD